MTWILQSRVWRCCRGPNTDRQSVGPTRILGAVAKALMAAGVAVWILGGPGDVAAAEAIARVAPGVRTLCGQTSLTEAIDLLAACPAVVTNDSGLMHVAAAVGSHVVAVYGSSSPDFTPPLTAASSIHYLNLDCSPCFKRECPLGHLNCLVQLEPAAVLASVMAVLGAR